MYYILARITVKPEATQTAQGLLDELVIQSRKEVGCISYELYQQEATPHIFQTVETWCDKAAADAHMVTPHLGAAVAAATPLFAAAPEILSYTKIL